MAGLVLMLTTERDIHAQVVSKRLSDLGAEAIILDTSRFPSDVSLSASLSADGDRVETSIQVDGRSFNGDDISGVWFRRPRTFRPPEGLLFQDDSAFIRAECKQAFEGWLHLMGDKMINDPHREQFANNKLFQLAQATRAGLAVPTTLTSNEPDRVTGFAAKQRIVFKPFTQPGPIIIPTRPFDSENAAFAHQIANAPHLYQQKIEKIADIRVNVIDDALFATRIEGAYADTPLDWRLDRNHRYRPHSLPTAVAGGIRRFMTAVGLRFGALDFGLCADGTHVFFEVNPSGQWLFCEIETGAALSEALAKALLKGPSPWTATTGAMLN